jgi:endonuclease/exonuclease/phosphatase family metal-dependent hydrolase
VKILSLNAGYFLGFDGTIGDYLKNPFRTVVGSDLEGSRNTQEFARVVADERPDAILLQEIDKGSIRSSPKSIPENIQRQLPSTYKAFTETKYGGLTGRLPFMNKMSNSIMTENGIVENHFLKSGTKNLVQELKIEDLSIFSVHLSRFGARTRRKQLEQIMELANKREKFVVAGDFNFMKPSEQEKAKEIFGRKFSPAPTFPAERPSRALDMVFSSEGLDISVEVLDENFSDHRPLLFEVS